MSLKTTIYPEVQAFMKPGTPDLLFGLQNAPTYKLLKIHEAYAKGITSNPISITLVKIRINKTEISRTSLATNLILYDATTDQYLIDTSKILTTLLDECIYFIEFQNSINLYQTEPFLVKEMTFKITADNILKTADNTVFKTNDTHFTI